jgi:riboflavin kinase/FMN adenylyltransferase
MAESAGFPQLARGSVVTVGTFDGVHLGHRDILRRVTERANASGLPGLLVTFQPHPLEVVNRAVAPMLLTPGTEQYDALADSGPLLVAVLPFTPTLASYSAEQFVIELLQRRYHMRELVIGYDHGLGRGREGDAKALVEIGGRHGFGVEIVPPTLDAAGRRISSSVIRTALAHSDLERAHAALGRRYTVRGTVVSGDRRGRAIGFPTLNLAVPSPRKLLPPVGVYAVRAWTTRGAFGGMMNLGPRPTVGDDTPIPEVHLFDTSGDWYGEAVSVEFVTRLRDTVKFESLDALVAQLNLDAVAARSALTQA